MPHTKYYGRTFLQKNQWNVSQPVRACEPGLGDLSKPTAPAYFFVVKVMLVGVVNFGQTQNEGLSVWKIFGHVQTNFRSSLFGQVN